MPLGCDGQGQPHCPGVASRLATRWRPTLRPSALTEAELNGLLLRQQGEPSSGLGQVGHRWPGAPVLVVTTSGPDGNTLYRLADPRCDTWSRVGDMPLAPWPDIGSRTEPPGVERLYCC